MTNTPEQTARTATREKLEQSFIRLTKIEAQRDILVRAIIETPHDQHIYNHDILRLDCPLCSTVQAFEETNENN